MRTSCNGCRVLRKGCSEDCNIRPCLQWIKSPESQANVTVFLAKFYGRAGLINLINAGPDHLRPAIFTSLLYEACGRIVDPIHGSVGLLWSGNWNHCQAAVDAVLNGAPIMQLHPISDASASHLIIPTPPLNASYDIRHVAFKEEDTNSVAAASSDFGKMKKIRTRSKRTRSKAAAAEVVVDQDESMFSVETVEASLVNGVNNNIPDPILKYGGVDDQNGDSEIGLELSLGLPPYMGRGRALPIPIMNGSGDDKMDVGV